MVPVRHNRNGSSVRTDHYLVRSQFPGIQRCPGKEGKQLSFGVTFCL